MLSIPLRYNQNLHLTIRKKFSFSETYSRSFMINEYWQLQHFHPQLMCSSNFLLLLKYFLSDLHLSSGFRLHATVDWFDFTVHSTIKPWYSNHLSSQISPGYTQIVSATISCISRFQPNNWHKITFHFSLGSHHNVSFISYQICYQNLHSILNLHW